jgi:hypothetical protein
VRIPRRWSLLICFRATVVAVILFTSMFSSAARALDFVVLAAVLDAPARRAGGEVAHWLLL